jgi:CRISPR system Cascade subunit CasA
MSTVETVPELHHSLLDEPLIRWRSADGQSPQRSSLPTLIAALANDAVMDFPGLRPHQRHPWHAFLVQLAAIALHAKRQAAPWTDASAWRDALLSLTPDDPDGAAWCLVSPPDRPALLQAPVPGENPGDWKRLLRAADELDMLVTSKNHELKAARARHAHADDWLFALLSLQTQAGYAGFGNYGVSRMNSGTGNRPGVGVAAVGRWGRRWRDDVLRLLSRRQSIAERHGLAAEGGNALLWLLPWDGTASLAMQALDPLYVEICRRVRLVSLQGQIAARVTTSKAERVAAKERNGITGDAWTPVDTAAAKALTVSAAGFEYRLMSNLLCGEGFTQGEAWQLTDWPKGEAVEVVARAAARGEGVTEGYHERRIPIAPKLRGLLAGPRRVTVAEMAKQRITAIAAIRKLLWSSLKLLFANGDGGDRNDAISDRASRFARPFEQGEDGRFFVDLSLEVEAEEREQAAVRLQWLIGLAERAEDVLHEAFEAGPCTALQRYKARSAALTRFHAGLRGAKPVLPDLAHHYARLRESRADHTQGETE